MKAGRLMVLAALLLVASSANAVTWMWNGTLYGNVCRNGAYFTVYPTHMGQPVGSACAIRDGMGNQIGWGQVSPE